MAGAVLLAFTLAFPHWAVDLGPLRERLAYHRWLNVEIGHPLARLSPTGIGAVRGLYEVAILFPCALGLPLYLLALVPLVRHGRPGTTTLLVFAAVFFIFFASAKTAFARYYLPIFPVLCVAAGVAADRLVRWRPGIGIAVVSLVFAYTLALSGSLVTHTSLHTQQALGTVLTRLAAGRSGPPPAVASLFDPGDYRGVHFALKGVPARLTSLELDRAWIETEHPDVVVVAEIDEIVTLRNQPASEAGQTLRALRVGTLPYRLAAEIEAPYFSRALYAWLDRQLSVSWERGEMGFGVWVRADAVPPGDQGETG